MLSSNIMKRNMEKRERKRGKEGNGKKQGNIRLKIRCGHEIKVKIMTETALKHYRKEKDEERQSELLAAGGNITRIRLKADISAKIQQNDSETNNSITENRKKQTNERLK